MAEEDTKSSKASKFLKRSKWGKILKEVKDDDPGSGQASRQGSFKLNEDVVDFLKPSTDKYVPKIDIAIAKRWPDAKEVRQEGDLSPAPHGMVYSKPKRRKGLTVTFVKTLPEIIGEGGDDAQEPTREIARQKAMVNRSASDRRAGSVDQGPGQWQRSPPLPQYVNKMPSPPMQQEEDFVPKPLRRVQTSHNEFSPAMQRKVATPPSEAVEPHKPSLGRAPTGFESRIRSFQHTTPLDTPVDRLDAEIGQRHLEDDRLSFRDRPPQIDTSFDHNSLNPDSAYSNSNASYSNTPLSGLPVKKYPGLLSGDAPSPVAQKRREMSASEGTVLRRASLLIQQGKSDEEDESPPQSRDQQHSAHSARTSPPYSIRANQPEELSSRNASLTSEQHPLEDRNGYRLQERRRSPERQTSYIPSPLQHGHQRTSSRDRYLSGALTSPGDMAPAQKPPLPQPHWSQHITVPQVTHRDDSRSPEFRDHTLGSGAPPSAENQSKLYARPNGSSASVTNFSPSGSHSRASSREGYSPSKLRPAHSYIQQSLSPQSPQYHNPVYSTNSSEHGSRTSLLGPGRGQIPLAPSPDNRISPGDHSATTKSSQSQIAKFAATNLRQEDASARPTSSGSVQSQRPSARPTSSGSVQSQRPSSSPQPPELANPAADAAYIDFAGRVAHMRGVFRLTAEKELPRDKSTTSMWLRSGLWWYLKGKGALEVLLQQRNPYDSHREYLTQAHVDLAKAWWILSEPLEAFDTPEEPKPQIPDAPEGPDIVISQGVSALRKNLKRLSLSMSKSKVLPPTQSLIQGQDTRIWLEYPRFSSDAAAVLSGNTSTSLVFEDSGECMDPYRMLPLSDSAAFFCYGRFPVEVLVNTTETETDRVVLPCMLTILRGRRDYEISIAIASQNELVSIEIAPVRGEKKSLTWADVSWKATSFSMVIRLPRGFDLIVRMQERDFRAVWNLSEYARKVEKSLHAEPDEKLVHEARLAELQYADSSNSNVFPSDKITGCTALIYEQSIQHVDGNGMRKLHRGYRILLITDPGHKTLSSVSHCLCKRSPLYFEFITDSAANGTTAMMIRIREDRRQCRILLVFPDMQRRQELYDVLNGLNVEPDETVVGKMSLTSLNIEAASQTDGFSQSAHPVLQTLQWQKLGVTNGQPDDPNSRIPSTVHSENLRIVARHTTGCITDRLNLGKGELLFHLPASAAPAVQILRPPQEDITMSIDTRHSPPQIADGIGQLLHIALHQETIRTFTFASQPDLHAFQTAITGFAVRFDGLASTLAIARRRMVVPIYKKWEASNVRLQLVSKDTIVQLIAFMEDFSHADSLCLQVKSTDVFETIKGDNKHKKWGVKLVDAKFSLPSKEKGEVNQEELVRRRFVNLDGLDYAEEHDDITIGFESEQERDRFAQALPAATSMSRGITLKRRI